MIYALENSTSPAHDEVVTGDPLQHMTLEDYQPSLEAFHVNFIRTSLPREVQRRIGQHKVLDRVIKSTRMVRLVGRSIKESQASK